MPRLFVLTSGRHVVFARLQFFKTVTAFFLRLAYRLGKKHLPTYSFLRASGETVFLPECPAWGYFSLGSR